MRFVVALLIMLGLVAVPPVRAEFKAKARDFRCVLEGVQPAGKQFYVFHRNERKLRQAVAVAERDLPGEKYPTGTIIQLLPFEAMAKRGGGFNRRGHGWEFFQLSITPENGSNIVTRGGATVANAVGPCQGCHLGGQAAEHDLVCEGNGAAPIALGPAVIRALQQGDPRCKK